MAARATGLRLLPLLCLATLGACVSLEEAPMAPDAVQGTPRTVVIVFASPGPAMSESSSNLDQAAKVVPGLGLMLKASQNQRDRAASQDLQQLLPAWQPAELFGPILMRELASSGWPGPLLTPAEAGLAPQTLQGLNRADDALDWQVRYCALSAGSKAPPAPRDYSALPPLKDSLVLEVNLVYGAPSDGEGSWTPELSSVTKLYRVGDMKLLWRHEDVVDDKAGKRRSDEFKKQPADLIAKCQGLMPSLAQALAGSVRKNLQEAARRRVD